MRRWRSHFAGVKYLLAGTFVAGALVAMSGAVNADGMAPKAAPVVAPTSWSGFYFGLHSGFAWSDFDASFPTGIPNFTVSHDAFVVGGHMGIQHQFGQVVLGVEGSLTTAFRDDHASTDCPPPNNTAFTCAARFDNVFTIGPRLGWAMGKYMPYITGGYANARFAEKISIKAAPANPFEDSQRHGGWFIGGGVDMALSHGWTIGLDYRHYDFDSANYVPSQNIAGGIPVLLGGAANSADTTADIVTLRVSWKFGRPEPVVRPLK